MTPDKEAGTRKRQESRLERGKIALVALLCLAFAGRRTPGELPTQEQRTVIRDVVSTWQRHGMPWSRACAEERTRIRIEIDDSASAHGYYLEATRRRGPMIVLRAYTPTLFVHELMHWLDHCSDGRQEWRAHRCDWPGFLVENEARARHGKMPNLDCFKRLRSGEWVRI